MKGEMNRGLMGSTVRGISLIALLGAVGSTGGCDEADEANHWAEAQCPDNAGTVIFTNNTGKHIQDVQIRSVDGLQNDSVIDPRSGLVIDQEIAWVDCFPGTSTRALVVTLSDGTVEQHELPAFELSTSRLRMTPGGITVEPPPPPKPPRSREVGNDPGGTVSLQPRAR